MNKIKLEGSETLISNINEEINIAIQIDKLINEEDTSYENKNMPNKRI